MQDTQPKIRVMGDRSLLVELGDGISREVNQRVRRLYCTLTEHKLGGVIELIPGYATLLVIFDPLRTSLSALKTAIARAVETVASAPIAKPRTVRIPVAYGGAFGPDLTWLAEFHHLTPDEVIRHHSSTTYQVYMIGFIPGFPYMGEVPVEIAAPRRSTPRTHVPQGSVAIAQRQTGIYPAASPGGWQIIGRTPFRLFDPATFPPTPLEPGDLVTFYAIERKAFDAWQP
ncbi:MAG: 5-oxoprolinase subunit PxpB [Desulfobacterales bacterium]